MGRLFFVQYTYIYDTLNSSLQNFKRLYIHHTILFTYTNAANITVGEATSENIAFDVHE